MAAALPAVAMGGAGMMAGFTGGLGYGMGLQYSYAKGFPAFSTGGAQGFVSAVRGDMEGIVNAFVGNQNKSTIDPNIKQQVFEQQKAFKDPNLDPSKFQPPSKHTIKLSENIGSGSSIPGLRKWNGKTKGYYQKMQQSQAAAVVHWRKMLYGKSVSNRDKSIYRQRLDQASKEEQRYASILNKYFR